MLDSAAPPGFRSPSLRLALDTADACIGGLAAYLIHGRFRRERRLQDHLLTQALTVLVVVGTVVPNLLPALHWAVDDDLRIWLSFFGRISAALLITAAAMAAHRKFRRVLSARHSILSWAILASVLLILIILMTRFEERLPSAISRTAPQFDAAWSGATMHGYFAIGNLVAFAAFSVASIGFMLQAERSRDAFLTWLGPATAIAGFARVNQLLVPTAYTDWLSTGDAFRTGFYLLLLVGAAREIGAYWGGRALEAVVEDRHRMARELHDGVVQELAFIRAEASSGPDRTPAQERIISASDRALDEARAALDSLHREGTTPLGAALSSAAEESAKRHGVRIEGDLDHAVAATPAVIHALTRIMREAISNAARHGAASMVEVRLAAHASGHSLTITDNGTGFDVPVTQVGSAGFGLISIRERAAALPGACTIASAPGFGTMVTILW